MGSSDEIDPVELLRRQYLQQLHPGHLTIPQSAILKTPGTQARIYGRLFDNVHSPPVPYQLNVLKRIIKAIENAIEDPDEDEVSDELSGCLASLMSKPMHTAAVSATAVQKSFVTYSAPSPFHKDLALEVTLFESPSLLASTGTTGLRTWEAALHLGRYLCSPRGISCVKDRVIVELGAGTGYLSLLCAKHLGAKYVLATDGSNEVVSDMQNNMVINGLMQGNALEISQLHWGHSLHDSFLNNCESNISYQLVIGADVTYDPQSIPALIATLRDLFGLNSATVGLIAATVRNEDTIKLFLQACHENAFIVRDLDFPLPRLAEQTGLFVINEPEVRIFEITISSSLKDVFAV